MKNYITFILFFIFANVDAQTYLPSLGQKHLISMASAGYTRTAKVALGLHHLCIDISMNVKDGANTYIPVLSLLDAYWPIAGNTTGSVKYNLVNNAIYTLSVALTNAPVVGSHLVTFIGASSRGYNTGWNPSVLGYSLWGMGNDQTTNHGNNSGWEMGCYTNSGTNSALMSVDQGGFCDAGINNNFSSNANTANTVTIGIWDITRESTSTVSGALTIWKNGVLFGTRSTASNAAPNSVMALGGTFNNGTFSGVGSNNVTVQNAWIWNTNPSSLQHVSFYNALVAYNASQ